MDNNINRGSLVKMQNSLHSAIQLGHPNIYQVLYVPSINRSVLIQNTATKDLFKVNPDKLERTVVALRVVK